MIGGEVIFLLTPEARRRRAKEVLGSRFQVPVRP